MDLLFAQLQGAHGRSATEVKLPTPFPVSESTALLCKILTQLQFLRLSRVAQRRPVEGEYSPGFVVISRYGMWVICGVGIPCQAKNKAIAAASNSCFPLCINLKVSSCHFTHVDSLGSVTL